MNNSSKRTNHNIATARPEIAPNPATQADMIARGLTTSIVVSTIIHAGRGIIVSATRKPVIMFGLGVVTGYFVHKYRKEIVSASHKTFEESRDFVLRQKENLQDRLAEDSDEAKTPKNLPGLN
jgi:hypothetical protein